MDLSELTYISSAGLVSLHTIALMTRGENLPDPEQGWSALKSMDRSRDGGLQKNLKLLNPRPEITSVLDMVGFSAFFEVFTDKQKAIDLFNTSLFKAMQVNYRIALIHYWYRHYWLEVI